jgi:hypothetical protein
MPARRRRRGGGPPTTLSLQEIGSGPLLKCFHLFFRVSKALDIAFC